MSRNMYTIHSKGSWPETCIQYTWLHIVGFSACGCQKKSTVYKMECRYVVEQAWHVLMTWKAAYVTGTNMAYKLTLHVSKGDKGILCIAAQLNIGDLITATVTLVLKIVHEQVFWHRWILGQVADQDCAALWDGVHSQTASLERLFGQSCLHLLAIWAKKITGTCFTFVIFTVQLLFKMIQPYYFKKVREETNIF